MSTWIKPKSNREWTDEFPFLKDEPDTVDEANAKGILLRWPFVNSVLYILAAFLTRGTLSSRNALVNKIVTAWVDDSFTSPDDAAVWKAFDDDAEMASLGRYVYTLVKVMDTKPFAGRGDWPRSDVKIEIREQ
jgi:hypothetical protein